MWHLPVIPQPSSCPIGGNLIFRHKGGKTSLYFYSFARKSFTCLILVSQSAVEGRGKGASKRTSDIEGRVEVWHLNSAQQRVLWAPGHLFCTTCTPHFSFEVTSSKKKESNKTKIFNYSQSHHKNGTKNPKPTRNMGKKQNIIDAPAENTPNSPHFQWDFSGQNLKDQALRPRETYPHVAIIESGMETEAGLLKKWTGIGAGWIFL